MMKKEPERYGCQVETVKISDDMISEITKHHGIIFAGCFDNIEKQ